MTTKTHLVPIVILLFAGIMLQAQTPEQIQAARHLFAAMKMEQQHRQTIDDIINPILQKHPELAQYKPKVDDYLNKNFTWEQIQAELAPIYARRFTVDEMKQMEQFFNTPAGQKFSKALAPIGYETISVFRKKIQQVMPPLINQLKKDVIRDKMAKFKR